MKAIVTKYLPATDRKESRIKATAEGVKSITIPYPHELSDEDAHRKAAEAICVRQGWPIQGTQKLVGGGLPDQSGYAFCFRD